MVKKKKGKKEKEETEELLEEYEEEKKILLSQEVELNLELDALEEELRLKESYFQETKHDHKTLLEKKEACGEHLKTRLSALVDNCERAQAELSSIQDQAAQNQQQHNEQCQELRASLRNEADHFQEQKHELEDELSQLEEKRVIQLNQQSRLRRAQEDLAGRSGRVRIDDEHMKRMSDLSERRHTIARLLDMLAVHSEQVFQSTLPVFAKQLMQTNTELQRKGTAERVIKTQDRIRRLQDKHRNLELEVEMQDSIDHHTKLIKERLKHDIDQTLEEFPKVNCPNDTDKDYRPISTEQHLGFGTNAEHSTSDTCLYASPKYELSKMAQFKEDNAETNVVSNIESRHEQFKLKDKLRVAAETMQDQEKYLEHLKETRNSHLNKNGEMCSIVLRAGEVFRSRCNQIKNIENQNEIDIEVIQQLRMFLNKSN